MEEKAETKKKLIMSTVIALITLLAAVTLVTLAGLLEMPVWLRIVLIILAVIIVSAGVGLACVIDRDTGSYECPRCGKKFVPSMRAYVMGLHSITRRRLKCPYCNKTSFCRKRLEK